MILISLAWITLSLRLLPIVQGESLEFNDDDGFVKLTDANIHQAVDEWIVRPSYAKENYGNIWDWDTSRVTDMHRLFYGRAIFKDDISHWNTSAVTNMAYLFNKAELFDQNLYWDTSNVRYLDGAFSFATNFNGDITKWSTESLISMDYAFSFATSFDRDISSWNTSSLKYAANAFQNATSFSKDLSSWEMMSVEDIGGMFHNAASYDHVLCWKLDRVKHASHLFCGSKGALDPKCMGETILQRLDVDCPIEVESEPTNQNEFPATLSDSTTTPTPGNLQKQPEIKKDRLKYAALIIAAGSLILILSLCVFVSCKRRQLKQEVTTRRDDDDDVSTVIDCPELEAF